MGSNRHEGACSRLLPCYLWLVIDERLILAIGRLERALSRIETVAQGVAPTSDAVRTAADPALAERHVSLRARTAEAIVRLDALLGDAA